VHTERFAIKPMYVDEAVLQMELPRTASSWSSSTPIPRRSTFLYRRKKGDFGLIEPTLK